MSEQAMNDRDFLLRCAKKSDDGNDRHLAPSEIARLCRLAGNEIWARYWDIQQSDLSVNCDQAALRELVAEALDRHRSADQGAREVPHE